MEIELKNSLKCVFWMLILVLLLIHVYKCLFIILEIVIGIIFALLTFDIIHSLMGENISVLETLLNYYQLKENKSVNEKEKIEIKVDGEVFLNDKGLLNSSSQSSLLSKRIPMLITQKITTGYKKLNKAIETVKNG